MVHKFTKNYKPLWCIITLVRHKKARFDSKMHGSTQKSPVRQQNAWFDTKKPGSTQKCPPQHAPVDIAIIKHIPIFQYFGAERMITSKSSLRLGFDCIIRPAPSGAGRTTPSQPGHYPQATPASKWSKLPLLVDGVRFRARVKFGLVSNYVFLSWLFPKIAINHRCRSK